MLTKTSPKWHPIWWKRKQKEVATRTGTTFKDPIKKGADKIGKGYIDKYLK